MPAQSFIRPVLVDQDSPFIGESCALCKQPFASGEHLIICPEDGSRHHDHCWRANGNKCTAYGCTGEGEILPRHVRRHRRNRSRVPSEGGDRSSRSKVRTMPSSSSNFGCAQTCLFISVAIAIVLIAAGCFGLWAVADYILIEVLGWQYRSPFTGMILPTLLHNGFQDAILFILFLI